MTTDKTLVGEQDPTAGQEGADQGEDWARNTEEQLLGDGTTPPPGKASKKGEPEEGDVIPFEVIQKHPAYAELMGKHDRQGNVLKFQTAQINQLTEQTKLFRDKQAAELLEQLGGDTEENRETVKRVQNAEDLYAQAMSVMQQFGPILKKEKATELLTAEGIPAEYLDELVACETFEEAVQKAQTIKAVLARLPKPPPGQKAPGQKPSGTMRPRNPALGHIPDKGQGSVAPETFEQAEEAYIAGRISFTQYKQAADKAGVKLQ